MRFATCLCVLIVAEVLVSSVDARKTFSSRRKSGGNNRRGGSTSFKHKPPPPPATPQKDTINTFLNSERVGSSHSSGSGNTHHRGSPFNNKPSAPEAPKNTVPQTNGPVGFEKFNNQGNQKIGFDKVNSEVQHKPVSSNVPSAPPFPGSPGNPPYPGSASYPARPGNPPYPGSASYPASPGNPPYPGGASYPAKPPVNAPNGPPPAYPGYGSPGTGTHGGSYEPPPAYPGRPVNAPPVYSANNPSYGQRNPAQPGYNSYPNQQGGYQQGHQQNSYPQQQGTFPGQNYPGQQNHGYSNAGSNFGSYPNQGYNQGFGSNPSGGFGGWNQGGYGQSYPGGYSGNSYGGSHFGQSNPYGGSPFASQGFGGNSFGNNNPYYSPNNFGYSSNPGFFGSQSFNPGYSGGYNGYHKKSRFGGLPIPIPIPIPIPLGMFGGFGGGHSYNHRVLNNFVKDRNVSTSDNTTVFILNNSTVTPCTTDQFIYESLNVTVLSCTAGNCTAIKIFATTNISGEATVHSAGITMCVEKNTTYSSYADNINPTVSDLHKYWIRVCKDTTTNSTGNVTAASNATMKVTETLNNETMISEDNTTATPSVMSTTTLVNLDTVTPAPISETTTAIPSETNSTGLNSTFNNSTGTSNSSLCENFECSWIKMCLPSIEIVDRCVTPECPFTRTGYQPCVILRMCRSPSTPISTFPSINTTISRIDQFNNITSVNDLANLTLVSYTPPKFPVVNCTQNATDPACQPPSASVPQDACVPSNSTEASVGGDSSTPSNGTNCIPILHSSNSTGVDVTTTEAPSTTTPVR